MVPAQVLLLFLVKNGLDLHGIAFVIESEVGGWQIVLSDFIGTAGPRIANIEVTRFDWMDEVFVRGHDCLVWILIRIDNRVGRGVAILDSSPQLDWASLSSDFSLSSLFSIPSSCLPCDSIIDCTILQVLGHACTDTEIRLLILYGRISLCLSPALSTGTSQLLVLSLWVVDGGVLAEDEMSASELVHMRSSLIISIVVSFLLIP